MSKWAQRETSCSPRRLLLPGVLRKGPRRLCVSQTGPCLPWGKREERARVRSLVASQCCYLWSGACCSPIRSVCSSPLPAKRERKKTNQKMCSGTSERELAPQNQMPQVDSFPFVWFCFVCLLHIIIFNATRGIFLIFMGAAWCVKIIRCHVVSGSDDFLSYWMDCVFYFCSLQSFCLWHLSQNNRVEPKSSLFFSQKGRRLFLQTLAWMKTETFTPFFNPTPKNRKQQENHYLTRLFFQQKVKPRPSKAKTLQ